MKSKNELEEELYSVGIKIFILFVLMILIFFTKSLDNTEKTIISLISLLWNILLLVVFKFKYEEYCTAKRVEKFINSKKKGNNPLELKYTKEQLEQMDSANEEIKRKTDFYLNTEEYKDLKFDKK